jgi:hypothetical protein
LVEDALIEGHVGGVEVEIALEGKQYTTHPENRSGDRHWSKFFGKEKTFDEGKSSHAEPVIALLKGA